MRYEVPLVVNGRAVSVTAKATTTLLDALRDQLRITSPKLGCETGDCGVCTVLIDGKPVKSCLVLAVTANGKQITTVEALGDPEHLHPLQQAFHDHYAAQCGFCTPSMVLLGQALLAENPHPSEDEVREAISGTLCRCTGYVNIVKAIQSAGANSSAAAAS